MDTIRRLHKSRADRMLDGICGGVAEYFGLDSTLVRLAWVLAVFLCGTGILLYILAMIIMPTDPSPAPVVNVSPESHGRNTKFWGILLIVVGSIWFLGNLGLPFWPGWWRFSWDIMLPVLLILAGVAFIFGGRNFLTATEPPESAAGEGENTPRPVLRSPARLHKSRSDRKVFGVCGGIADFFLIDPTIVRLLFVVATLAAFGFMLLLYIVMAIIVPEEPAAVHG